MKRGFSCFALLVLLGSIAQAATIPPPVTQPYAPQRKLFTVDYFEMELKDKKRDDRSVPVKVYFPKDADGQMPIVIFSHGLGGTRRAYEYLGRQWAAHGYFAVHLQHLGSDDAVWRGANRPMEKMRDAVTVKNGIDRADDVAFAIDSLAKLNTEESQFKGRLDLKSIGVAGHSFGAHTAMAVAGQNPTRATAASRPAPLRDARVKAVIAMSPNVPIARTNLDAIFDPVTIPVFYMSGTKDDSPVSDTKAADRRIPFDHTNHSSAAYLLMFAGGDHMIFSGRLADRRESDPTYQEQIRLAATAFWDAYLRNDPGAKKWLDDEGGFKTELGNAGTFERK